MGRQSAQKSTQFVAEFTCRFSCGISAWNLSRVHSPLKGEKKIIPIEGALQSSNCDTLPIRQMLQRGLRLWAELKTTFYFPHCFSVPYSPWCPIVVGCGLMSWGFWWDLQQLLEWSILYKGLLPWVAESTKISHRDSVSVRPRSRGGFQCGKHADSARKSTCFSSLESVRLLHII